MNIKNHEVVYQDYSEELHQIIMEIFIVWVAYIHLEQIINLKITKDYVIIMIMVE